ncbi:type 1 fimbriae anchoring protein FimD [Klebsiella pneumoniae ISC21]|nr:type 1 fimbriae anchoring protein FimD [Klebsiella pneumoniae ISC21]
MPLAGKVRVKWGDGPDAQCVADYPSAAGEPAAGAQSAFGRVPLRRT